MCYLTVHANGQFSVLSCSNKSAVNHWSITSLLSAKCTPSIWTGNGSHGRQQGKKIANKFTKAVEVLCYSIEFHKIINNWVIGLD